MKTIITGAVLATLFSAPSFAQSSVTLYGMVDSGIRWTNNEQGAAKTEMSSGTPTRWGLKGNENLGGGLSTVFVLENGFNQNTGALGQNGRMFGRQAFVGIASNQFGTVTAGRQYDSMVDYLQPLSAGGHFYAGGLGAHYGDIDNVNNGFRLSNAVKYTNSQLVKGLTFGGLYSLGGTAGNFQQNNAATAGASYSIGQFSVAAAYMRVNNPLSAAYDGSAPTNINGFFPSGSPYAGLQNAQQLKTYGVGASYTLSPIVWSVLYTNTLLVNSQLAKGDARYQNIETSVVYHVTPAFDLGLAYNHTAGYWSSDGLSPRFDQINFGAVYSLSKATRLYMQSVYQRAGGSAQYAEIPLLPASTNNHQMSVQLAINHLF